MTTTKRTTTTTTRKRRISKQRIQNSYEAMPDEIKFIAIAAGMGSLIGGFMIGFPLGFALVFGGPLVIAAVMMGLFGKN